MFAFVYFFSWAVSGIGSHSSEPFLKIVCLGQLEINGLLPFLKIKTFSCLTISQYFHLCNYLLEMRTLKKQVWESSPLLYIWCYFSFSGFLRISKALFWRDSWSLSATVLSSLPEVLTPQGRAHRKHAEFSPSGRSYHLACVCQPWTHSQAKPHRISMPRCSAVLAQL